MVFCAERAAERGCRANVFLLSAVPNFSISHMSICLVAELGERTLNEDVTLQTPRLESFGGEIPISMCITPPSFQFPGNGKQTEPRRRLSVLFIKCTRT